MSQYYVVRTNSIFRRRLTSVRDNELLNFKPKEIDKDGAISGYEAIESIALSA